MGGGECNRICGNSNAILVGCKNEIFSVIDGSGQDVVNDSIIGAGFTNYIAASGSFIGGGRGNQILSGAFNGTIVNAISGSITDGSTDSAILAGRGNTL